MIDENVEHLCHVVVKLETFDFLKTLPIFVNSMTDSKQIKKGR